MMWKMRFPFLAVRFPFLAVLCVGCEANQNTTSQGEAQDVVFINANTQELTITNATNVSIPATTGGSFLVLGLSYSEAQIERLMLGDRPFDPWLRSSISDCGNKITELWILPDAPGGFDTISVRTASEAKLSFAELEFGGLESRPDFTSISGDPVKAAMAPALPADPGQVVISTLTSCGTLTGMSPESLFTTPVSQASDSSIAFIIATEHGVYGAEWSYDGGTSVGNTAVFGTRALPANE